MRARLHKWRFSDNPAAFLTAGRKVPSSPPGPTSPGPSSEEDTKFISAKDAAAWLGIPLRSLHQYVQQGLLPCYKIGRHRLFRKPELVRAMEGTIIADRRRILR